MARKNFVCGNWKMFTSSASAIDLAQQIAGGATSRTVSVAICPPFPYLAVVAKALAGSSVALGAQNLYPAREGAFTGEVSPEMLLDVGCQYVIIGHSERRNILGETNLFINQKVRFSAEAGLNVIFCVGETLEQRTKGDTQRVLLEQVEQGLAEFPAQRVNQLVVAYEPVWAIGTGVNATPEQAQEAHLFIRQTIAAKFGGNAAENLVIQYGGSVKPDNARVLMQQPDVDGALVGGASLKADSFLAIVQAAIA